MNRHVGQPAPQRGPFIGRPLPRFEDLRLVRGAGRYTDDMSVCRVRPSRCSCARPTPMRDQSHRHVGGARRPGVLAVLTGEDYVADGHIGMAHFPNPADADRHPRSELRAQPERKILDELQLPLAVARVRYVGEAVAVVVAETLRPRATPPKRSRSNTKCCPP